MSWLSGEIKGTSIRSQSGWISGRMHSEVVTPRLLSQTTDIPRIKNIRIRYESA